MQMHIFRAPVLTAALFIASLLFGADAFAQCCPGGGGAPKAASGLGESAPPATDLAVDPEWQVYEFERGGIRYVQINDSAGKVRAAVGRIDDVFWVMPIGGDADRVTVDAESVSSGPGKVLYRTAEVEVILHRTVSGDYWDVRRPDATY
ncbi:MAG: hypothetical protein ACOY82_18445 [Pseudomonadota bacterium]